MYQFLQMAYSVIPAQAGIWVVVGLSVLDSPAQAGITPKPV